MSPTFSIVTPVHDPDARVWAACVASVLGQLDPDWEWIVVNDGGRAADIDAALATLAGSEPRVRLVDRPRRGGIVAATNDGLRAVRGEFVCFLDHDDELHPEALRSVRQHTRGNDVDLLYSDEVVIDDDGAIVDPLYKPGWSPERLRAHNYVNHLVAVRHSLLDAVGGLRDGFDGSQDHDLVLRASERARTIAHLPYPLYRWRMSRDSVLSGGLDSKPYAWENGRRAVQDHCDRVGIAARVDELVVPGVARWYRVVHRLPDDAGTALVVPIVAGHAAAGDPAELAEGVSEAVRAAGHPALDVVLAFGADVPDDFAEQFKALVDQAARVVRGTRHTSWAAVANSGAVRSEASFLLFLDPAARVSAPGWAATLVAHAAVDRVGAVAARLMRPGGVLEHAGYGLVAGEPLDLLRGLPATTTAYAGAALVAGERSAVTGRCLAVSSARFAEVGGFSPSYTTAFHDVDLCLKLRTAGYRNVYQPAVSALWSGTTRPAGHEEDLGRLQQRWGDDLRNDPYVNPGLIGAEWLTRR
jgi:GT2 family glycosyltransferase